MPYRVTDVATGQTVVVDEDLASLVFVRCPSCDNFVSMKLGQVDVQIQHGAAGEAGLEPRDKPSGV